MKRILILCTGNAARSQMAEGWLRSFDSDLEVHSAGTAPAPGVSRSAIAAMAEVGVDISAATPKNVNQFLDQPFDWVLTVCDHANEVCPAFHGAVKNRLHIGFEDPAGADLAQFRRVRDQIRIRLQPFYRDHLGPKLRAAEAADLDAVQTLLAARNLPLEGVTDRFGPAYVVADRDGLLIGVAGVEKFGRFGLLRSVAVAEERQGRGLGQLLTRNRIDWSREQGIDSLYLLTTTAPEFFARQGFREISRLAVPIEIRTCHEFASICPDSSTVMEFRIR